MPTSVVLSRLQTSGGDAGKGEGRAGCGSPFSKLTVSHALHLVLICAVPWGVSSLPGFEVKGGLEQEMAPQGLRGWECDTVPTSSLSGVPGTGRKSGREQVV